MIRWTCEVCGTTARVTEAQLPIHCCGRKYFGPTGAVVRPAKVVADCRHRGAELRQVECASCGGNVRIKVFACALFGECTLGKPLPGVPTCEACSRYEDVEMLNSVRSHSR
jgi:hypothetical protein